MNKIYTEAKKLHDLGFAILWLHKQSKRPVGNDWTSGGRKTWPELESLYSDGFNVGVRTGTPSMLGNNYLACIDVDIKDPSKLDEVLKILKKLVGNKILPEVRSGSGNGSKHLYCVTSKPFKMITVAKEKDAFEICIYSDGRQMALPPSLHPSGSMYAWARAPKSITDFPFFENEFFESFRAITQSSAKSATKSHDVIQDFKIEDVELDLVPVHPVIKNMIVFGEKAKDRSGALLPICSALNKAGLTPNQILTVLTDPNYYIGEVGYDHTKSNSRERAAAWVYKYSLKKILDEQSAEKTFEAPIEDPKELTFDELGENEKLFSELRHWTEDLDTTQHGVYRSTLKNIILILNNEFEKGLIKRDLFAVRDFYTKATPWGGKPGGLITDDDLAQMKHWFGQNWGFEPTDMLLSSAVTCLALDNSFDPLIEKLEALPEWDETPRLDTWLEKYFEAEGDPDYLAQVFRKWMIALIMRAYEPGAKFDWMPIFEGPQGVGKSSFGRLLVGDQYFLDWLPDLTSKDAALSLQGIWAVEIGELATFRKTELEVTKAFVTRTIDKVRPPYGRRQIESPRRCVFFGTTNHDTYLRDETGNRRFKPVKVGNLNFRQLQKDREQLFAEALAIYKYGFENLAYLDITGDAKIYEKKIQGEKMVQDDSAAMKDILIDFFITEKKRKEHLDFNNFKMRELFDRENPMLGLAPLSKYKFDVRNQRLAAKALRELGAEKKGHNGLRSWKISTEHMEHIAGALD